MLCVAASAAPMAALAEGPTPLFSASPSLEAGTYTTESSIGLDASGPSWHDIDFASHSATIRSRTARLDLGHLHATRELDSNAPITLNLFDEVSFGLPSPRFAPTSSGYSLSGDLDGEPFGTATLVVNDEVVVGSVHTSQRIYTIRSVGPGGLVQIRELGPGFARFDEPDALALEQQSAFKRGASSSGVLQKTNEETIVDLLVVWSPEAEEEAGGNENMVATVDYLAAYANKVFEDSGTQTRLNIPHMQKVETEDDGGLNVWHELHGQETPLEDNNVRQVVMDLRDRVGADLVHFIASGYPCAAIANIPTSVDGDESRFLSMSMYGCASTVFVHEIGHNFGLHHERFLDARKPLKVTPYGHGYVNEAAFVSNAPVSSGWRTVMAYGDQCSDLPFECPWLPRFSDPGAEHLGDPLGVPGEVETHGAIGPADARRTIDEIRSAIAGYRSPRPNLSLATAVDDTALDTAERFALMTDITNLGRKQATATTLVAYRSADAEFSSDDEEAGREAVDALGPSGTVSRSLELTAPADPGKYHYFACVDDAVAIDPCDVVAVTVGPTVSVANAETTEGQAIRFPVSMSATFPIDVQVSYAVSPDTAIDGLDFNAAAGTLSIPAGETEAWIEVSTIDDAVAEPRDALRVALSAITPGAPDGPVVSADTGTAQGTIVDDDGEFSIPNKRLQETVLRALGKGPGERITAEDIASLTELTIEGAGDLTGLEFAAGLLSLRISGDALSNLSAIGHLPALRLLRARSRQGLDLEPLRGLKTLRTLDLSFNALQDLAPLAGLTGLRYLDLRRTRWLDACTVRGDVSDLSPLAGLVDMRELHLECNRVSDLRALSGMSRLRQLWLPGNEISSLAGLEDMPSLWLLALDDNPLSNLSPIQGLTEVTWLTLTGASVSDLSPLSGMTKLVILKLANNGAISNISALQPLRSCGELDLSGNNISDLLPLRELEALRTLDLSQNRISEISPLSKLALSRLNLDGNLIEDVSPLRDVPLTQLSLRSNLIENIAPLSDIGSLTHLWLDGNAIGDIGPLASLTGLQRLSLGRNVITEIAALSGLTDLVELDLSDNFVSDVEPLAGLSRLESLQLGNNLVADVSVLTVESRPPALRRLYLYGNPLAEESVVTHLPHLREAGVSVYRSVALATDASANEGEVVEAVVRLTEDVTDPVKLTWGVLDAKVRRFRSVVDVEATASVDDFDTAGACPAYRNACRNLTIPAGITVSDTYLHTLEDDLQEAHEVFVIELSGSPATLPAEVSLPQARPGWLSVRISQAVGLIVDPTGPSHTAPLFPAASGGMGQGFMRIVNRGGRSAVHIEALDAEGNGSTTTLSIHRGQTTHFNSNDLEDGNFAKGLSRGTGIAGDGRRLRLWANDIRALSYIRTADGFLTSMHDLVAKGPAGSWLVPIFNPGSNRDQVSKLKLFNEGDGEANIRITGIDDDGNAGGTVRFTLAGGMSRTVTAEELESGQALDGGLGDGQGKWRLTVASDTPIALVNLLQSPTGHLTNLSTMPANQVVENGVATHHVPYFPSAADAKGRQGFVRVINHGTEGAAVGVIAYDFFGSGLSTSLTVPGGAAVHFNSNDLEMGNTDKGIQGVGAGTGDWRLELESESEIDVLAYIRHDDGFLTSMHDVATETGNYQYEIPTFNPGSNLNQVSHLLLANSSGEDTSVTLAGVDDRGVTHEEVSLMVPARRTVTVSAQDLESGSATTTGYLGDGSGKWRLWVTSNQPLWVMSLLESPSGHLTNLSTLPKDRGG